MPSPPSSEGEIWDIGYDSGGCMVVTAGTAVDPIEKVYADYFAQPNMWRSERISGAGKGERLLQFVYNYTRVNRLLAIVSLRNEEGVSSVTIRGRTGSSIRHAGSAAFRRFEKWPEAGNPEWLDHILRRTKRMMEPWRRSTARTDWESACLAIGRFHHEPEPPGQKVACHRRHAESSGGQHQCLIGIAARQNRKECELPQPQPGRRARCDETDQPTDHESSRDLCSEAAVHVTRNSIDKHDVRRRRQRKHDKVAQDRPKKGPEHGARLAAPAKGKDRARQRDGRRYSNRQRKYVAGMLRALRVNKARSQRQAGQHGTSRKHASDLERHGPAKHRKSNAA